MALLILATAFLNAATKMKMELWNRWTYEMYDGDVTKNELSLQRGYFRLEPTFGSNISGRFNVDFFSSDKDSDTDGAGLKIKYAYLDFKNLLPLKEATLTVGLMKTYFGTIYEYEYVVIEKDPSDLYKFAASADYGFGISGYFPKGFGNYAIAVYNGEGYKYTGSKINIALNPLVNIRITPVPGVTVGGSYFMKNKNNDQVDGEDNPSREDYTQFAGVMKLAYGPASILGQFLQKTTDKPHDDAYEEKTEQVISVLPVFKINEKFEIVGRYDMYDKNTDVDDEEDGSYDIMIGGCNYNIMRDEKNVPTLFVQVNFERIDYKAEDSKPVDQLMVQLRWIFSGVIN